MTRAEDKELAGSANMAVPIGLWDTTPDLACESGFNGVIDLLKIAKRTVVARTSTSSGSTTYLRAPQSQQGT
jgi:hypothetical protein